MFFGLSDSSLHQICRMVMAPTVKKIPTVNTRLCENYVSVWWGNWICHCL